MKPLGLKLGFDAIATTAPDRASSTTTAPALASSCRCGSTTPRTVDALLQRLLGDPLASQVDGELHVVARLPPSSPATTLRAALVVDLDLVLARRAAELRLVQRLDAGLPDDVAAS